MIEGHRKVDITQFLGMYSRGDTDNIPVNHFSDALNIAVDGEDIKTREGSVLAFTKPSILRKHQYKKFGEATRFLILVTGGNIYDSTDLNTPILSIATMTDFSICPMYNRIFITPHTRLTGLAGEKVYIYDGTGVARAAAGTAPTGFTLGVADSALSGYVEAGYRLFAVAFETSTGFITQPGPTVFTGHTSAGGFKLDLSAVPVGPSGTAARHIICTKMIDAYDGNQNAQSFYFAYGGRIADNTATTVTLDFFDAQLVESADYLFDQLTEIPASLGLLAYQDSLVTWGENSYPYLMRVSKQGEPESFNGEVGFLQVEPTDSSALKNVVEYRNQLIICKSERTAVTIRNPGYEAAFWSVTSIDPSIGTEVFGIGQVLGSPGSFQDFFVAAHRSGLVLFNGAFSTSRLTDKIQDLWNSLNKAYFDTVQVVMDTDRRRIYCAVPTGSNTYPDKLLVGDYTLGLNPESIQWYWWSFPIAPRSISLDKDYTTKKTVLYYSSTNVYKLSDTATDDYSNAIDSYFKTAKIPLNKEESQSTFSGLRMRISGSGSLSLTVSGEDDVNPKTLTSRTLSATPGKPLFSPLNYVAERLSITVRVNTFSNWFRLRSFHLFGTPIWKERPL